jgi:hypothetical protein
VTSRPLSTRSRQFEEEILILSTGHRPLSKGVGGEEIMILPIRHRPLSKGVSRTRP